LDQLGVTYDQSLNQQLRNAFKRYGDSKSQFETLARISVWNSLDNLLQLTYFVNLNLKELKKPVEKLWAILFKGPLNQVIYNARPLSPAIRAEFDRHIDRVTNFFLEELDKKTKAEKIKDWLNAAATLEKLPGLVASGLLLLSIVNFLAGQVANSAFLPYSIPIAVVSSLALLAYLLWKYRHSIRTSSRS
jgi:hypothetical protein